jgi:hypothetical protein
MPIMLTNVCGSPAVTPKSSPEALRASSKEAPGTNHEANHAVIRLVAESGELLRARSTRRLSRSTSMGFLVAASVSSSAPPSRTRFLSSPDLASVQPVGRPNRVSRRLLAGHIYFGS